MADTPEERVRQALLSQMLGPLGFPRALVAVEQLLPATRRRADIVAYRKRESELIPLVLIECKAEELDEGVVFRQAMGYNDSLAAPYWCLAHAGGIRTFWKVAGQVRSVPFLPPYLQLVQR